MKPYSEHSPSLLLSGSIGGSSCGRPSRESVVSPKFERADSLAGSMQAERSDAVVVGGGIVGAATLYHLAERGCERPLLLERDTLASGSTGYCAGGVRTLFSDELNIRIGRESIP